MAKPLDPPAFKIDTALAEQGRKLYAGAGRVSGGSAPDLRESPIASNREAFKNVVLNGALIMNGMPQYKELKDQDIDALLHFIRLRAREAKPAVAAK